MKDASYSRLSRVGIAQEAIRLVSEEGLKGLTARALARRLNCEAMSLYHHVKGMDDLHDAMVGELLGSIDATALATGQARELRDACIAILDLAVTYPQAFTFVALRRWRAEQAIKLAQAMIACLIGCGLDQASAVRRARIIGAYLNGAGLALAAWSLDKGEGIAGAGAVVGASKLSSAAVREDILAGLELLLKI